MVVIRDIKNNRDNIVDAVLSVETISKASIYGYHGNAQRQFLKCTMALPRMLAAAKRLLDSGLYLDGYPTQSYQTYESNIEYEIRLVE